MDILSFKFQDFLSAFIILFAVIDITGLTPIIIDMKQRVITLWRGRLPSIRSLPSWPSSSWET